jgi:hypothetical protein
MWSAAAPQRLQDKDLESSVQSSLLMQHVALSFSRSRLSTCWGICYVMSAAWALAPGLDNRPSSLNAAPLRHSTTETTASTVTY